ncbi:unnamed protein product [Allacma fusca]|uniref:Uncharacterized protein n=1 Tax=Allacma fusca TaxID=39272 RepID=A0A8J2JQK5_9HEXA|nr:unnamed protein product [Allacma fusca]
MLKLPWLRLGKDVENWMADMLTSNENQFRNNEQIYDLALATLLFSPYHWVKQANTDKKSYLKLVTYFKMGLLIAIFDDYTDSTLIEEEHLSQFYFSIAKIVRKIFSFDISASEEINYDQDWIRVAKVIPICEQYLNLLLDFKCTLETHFSATKNTAKFFMNEFLSYGFGVTSPKMSKK